MALLYRAELHPSKLDLLAGWLPARPWFAGTTGVDVTRVAGYRFDDPAGEVGMETLLVRAGDGPVLHAPLTYRGAPLARADRWLIGTTEHSVLGRRWVYDAVGDPVYQAALAGAVLDGAGQAEEYFEVDGRREVRPASVTLRGGRSDVVDAAGIGAVHEVVDGESTRLVTDRVELVVVRRPGSAVAPSGARMTGAWPGTPAPVVLAYATPR